MESTATLRGSQELRLRPGGRWLLALFCIVVFGGVAIGGRPMTLHEARVPQLAREMLAHHNWIVPQSGGRPWTERPPIPHWLEILNARLLGQTVDTEWSARIPPAVMGLLVVLLVAEMTARLLGRSIGLATGFILATQYEFATYATLAEDDIFLAALVTAAIFLFVRDYFLVAQTSEKWPSPIGKRSLTVAGFFVFLGLANLAKGPMVGPAVIVGTVAVYLLWQLDWRAVCRYLWVWGLVIFLLIGGWWYWWVWRTVPGYLENLKLDFHDPQYNEPFWYYPVQLLGVTLPWSPAALIGLCATAKAAFKQRDAVLRFVWCWAIVPIVILSLPQRKHHHYLVPSLAPWAILAAIGARDIARLMFGGAAWSRRISFGMVVLGIPGAVLLLVGIWLKKVPGPPAVDIALVGAWLLCIALFYHGLHVRRPAWLLAAIVIGIGVVFDWGQAYWPNDTVPDTLYLKQVNATVPDTTPLYVNAALGSLDFFRVQFYLRDDAILIHNLSYLRSDRIHSRTVNVLARMKDLPILKTMGDARMLSHSPFTHGQKSPQDRLALFSLTFDPSLKRYPPPPVSPAQAIVRAPGPWCGPPIPQTE